MKQQIMNEIKEKLEERLNGAKDVQMTTVTKNNGVVLNAVVLKTEGQIVAPTIYIDGIIEAIEEDEKTVAEAVEEIIKTDEGAREEGFAGFFDDLTKEKLLERTVYQLVNREKNEEMLKTVPHKDVCDLALVYRCVVSSGEEGTGSFVIRNDFAKQYGITVEELDMAAREHEEYTIRTIMEVICGLGCDEEELMLEMRPEDRDGLWVLSNKKQVHGASVIASEETLSKLAERLDDDLYILPSSIHEVLAMRVSNKNVDELRGMVGDVNETQVSEEERLSYNVYKYDRADRVLMIA